MEPQYPQNLFAALAKNILLKSKGLPETATIVKEASDQPPGTPPEGESQADRVNQFLSQYNFTPSQFSGDPAAARVVNPTRDAAIREIRNSFRAQAKMMGGMNPTTTQARNGFLAQINDQAEEARVHKSIDATMRVADKNPAQFGNMIDLSNRSQKAFDHNKTTEIATPLAALAGGIGGSLLGKSRLGRLSSGIAGAVAGGLIGRASGRAAEEQQTGYSHQDVMKPYEVAGRMDRRIQTDAKVK